jgi:enoyl-CoA hydratase/carnithine racemase
MHACQARRIPVGLSCTMPDLLADPLAVRVTKELAWRGLEMSLAEGLRLYAALGALVRASEDAREGPRAFAEKRQPQFEGR